jgi:uncharacterized protein (DUF433 family)
MSGLSAKNLVTDLTEVIENIKRYQDDLTANIGLVARMSRHPAWYAIREKRGQWLFGPSKFVGYAEITAKEYLRSYRRKDGRETERVLADWFEAVDSDSVLGRQLESQLRQFFARYGKVPNKLRRISVVRSELGGEIGDRRRNSSGTRTVADRISVDPEICGGRPCIRGTRVRVSDILDMIADGASPDDIVKGYPYLDRDDVAAALSYAARAVDHRIVHAA